MANHINLPKDKELASKLITSQTELDHEKMQQGYLGRIWGSSSSIPNNLAALTIVILLLIGIIYTLCAIDKKPADVGLTIKDFWSIISPLVTLSIGYLFGDKTKKTTNVK